MSLNRPTDTAVYVRKHYEDHARMMFQMKSCVKDEWKIFIQQFVLFAVIQPKTEAQLQDFQCKRNEF
jgi:hypothetical protein